MQVGSMGLVAFIGVAGFGLINLTELRRSRA